MKIKPYTFTDNSILEGKRIVMHSWETPIMKKMAEWVCARGGDILEIGVGSGLNIPFYDKNKVSKIIALDPSEDLNSMAKIKAKAKGEE